MPNTTDADVLDAQQAETAKKIRECACGNYSDATTGERITCDAETTRTFAPGHDAKLKSLLIRIGVARHEVLILGKDEPQSIGDVAHSFGFSGQVLRGVKAGRDKAVAKANRAATKELEKTLGV